MGNLLGAPVTDKETHTGTTSDSVPYGVSSMQGWRVHMEDAHITETRLYASDGTTKIELAGHAMFAVFDGHGGTYSAMYSGRNMCRVLSCQPKFVEYANFTKNRPSKEKDMTAAERAAYVRQGLDLLEGALKDAFVEIDKEIAYALKGAKVADADASYHDDEPGNSGGDSKAKNDGMEGVSQTDSQASPTDSALQLLEEEGDSGTTACVVLLTPEWVVCANAGDSRAVISRLGNKAVPLSYDHKPDDVEEERRIRAAGGYVAGGRVEGDLAVSRGLGDFRFKNLDVVMTGSSGMAENIGTDESGNRPAFTPGDQKVSPIPDVIVQNRNPSQDEFIIVACDGIWDVQTNYEAVKMIAELFDEGEADLGLLSEEVCVITHGRRMRSLALRVHIIANRLPRYSLRVRRYWTFAWAWVAKTT
jgi:serine/threonine protein phosphatase PrpC